MGGKDGRIQINDSIVKLNDVEPLMYAKRKALPNVIVSLRIDKGTGYGTGNRYSTGT